MKTLSNKVSTSALILNILFILIYPIEKSISSIHQMNNNKTGNNRVNSMTEADFEKVFVAYNTTS